jgi:hypothetical protein
MPNQMAGSQHLVLIRGTGRSPASSKPSDGDSFQHRIHVADRHSTQTVQEILFDLFAYSFGENQPAYSGCA